MSDKIEVVGSFNPKKEWQDRVRVLWGYLPIASSNGLQKSAQSACENSQ